MEQLTSVAAIVGLINGLKLFENSDKKPFYYFLAALLFGVIFGYLKFFGIDGIEQGLLIALASSGFYKLSTKIGGI